MPKIALPTRTWVAPKRMASGEIRAHPHGKQRQPVTRRDFGGQGEMRRRGFVDRRDAHQAGDRRGHRSARQAAMKASASSGRTPAFCGSAPVLISTNSSGLRPACRSPWRAPRTGSAGRANGWRRTARPRPRLVRLQRADQMQLEAGMRRAQGRPLAFGLLDAVFAEHALAGGDDRLESVSRERFSKPPAASPRRGRARSRGRLAPRARARLRAGTRTNPRTDHWGHHSRGTLTVIVCTLFKIPFH